MRILLFEDNPADTRYIQEMLTEAGLTDLDLRCVERLSAGLECLAEGEFDVILLDLGLPDSQGLDTFTRMYRQAPRLPIIVFSGLDDEEIAVNAVSSGAQDYMVKGQVSSNLLARAIRYATERKKMQNELKQHRDHLEDKVRERTDELQAMVNAMAGREVRMAELKEAIRSLRAQLEEAGLIPVADDPLKEGSEA